MRPKFTCQHCGKTFRSTGGGNLNKYCSRSCASIASRTPLRDRFNAKVDQRGPDECWEWTGANVPAGYGHIGEGGKGGRELYAHRLAYEYAYGPIPDGMIVCHRCDNPPCCNPAHLFVGTHSDNTNDMYRKGRNQRPDARGSRNVRARLTESFVRDIRNRYAAGGITQEQLANEYGVAEVTINHVIRRRTWTHVD